MAVVNQARAVAESRARVVDHHLLREIGVDGVRYFSLLTITLHLYLSNAHSHNTIIHYTILCLISIGNPCSSSSSGKSGKSGRRLTEETRRLGWGSSSSSDDGWGSGSGSGKSGKSGSGSGKSGKSGSSSSSGDWSGHHWM